jgi:hypothetical protein
MYKDNYYCQVNGKKAKQKQFESNKWNECK